jgi:hypothetical protein
MKLIALPPLLLLLLLALSPSPASDATSSAEAIDWNRARRLLQQEQGGAALSEEDRAYLERAKEARRSGRSDPRARAQTGAAQRPAPASLVPLCDLGADGRYEGEDGGLYGGGRNAPPEALREAALAALAEIRPLDREGLTDDEGLVGLVSISMSNATQEFSTFKGIADADPRKSPRVAIVDCAQGGQAMAEWAPPEARPWQVAMERLAKAGVDPRQVQVAWVKLANKSPSGSMEEHLAKLEADTVEVLRNAKGRFPNLRIVYLGSRIWAGNARSGLNPEPYAYESAFAARRLIQRQISVEGELATEAFPLLLWGPYLWSEGERGRRSDGLVYLPEDFAPDGVHPSPSGRRKVASQLLEFFANDPLARPWFSK